ncbi:MAG: hypothetical protein IJV04_00915, partial [Lachnospiraceae bacterium]|nr:hypothetical protein [Lachnospiraceae bacterium]
MPNGTFDASQMKMHLKQHLEQIGDLLTTAEDIEQYADFTGALNDLNRLTEDHYTLSPEGTFPLVTVENKKKLQEAYQNAIQAASRIAAGQETGPVNIQLRTIAGELLPMLETDNAALEMTNVARTPVTLPVLIGNARAQAVDMGDQQAEIAAGQMSSRQHIKVQNGRTIEEGYFTPTTTQDLEKRCDAYLDRMEKKYPEFRTIIDAFKKTDKDTLFSNAVEYEIFDYYNGNMSPDEIRNAVIEICRDDIFGVVGIEPDVYRPHMQNPDFLKFMDEFGKGMIPLKSDYKVYRSGGIVDLPEGTNIDKRNVGMTRMADMLGKP